MTQSQQQRIKKFIPIMNAVSPTFCLAKWHHVTLYLQTGETHSCYHPAPHKIDLTELADNPSALHNTSHKKLERKEMLEGVQTAGCQYCWNIENMGPDYISDRHLRSASIYTEERMKEVVDGPWNQNINPEYVEISFGNECNFKCGYCHPKASSRFYNEIKMYGPVTSVKNHRCDIDWMDLYEREEKNPYVDAWWRWWPEMRSTLSILRITGGEPLMHVSTWKLFQSLRDEPMSHLELNINSNLGVKPTLVNKMIDHINYLTDNDSIRRFKLYTSIDTWGTRAEYIRTGLDLSVWEQNFDRYLKLTGQPVSFMITFNILSVTTFKSLLEKILEWRTNYNQYNKTDQLQMIRFDTPYLKEPLQYDMNILPKEDFMPYMRDSLKFMENNIDDTNLNKFTNVEFEKFRRVVDYMESTDYGSERTIEGRRDFYNWFNELDTRRGTDFAKTFPEMKTFFEECKNI
jgi:organic radical activating enzyme